MHFSAKTIDVSKTIDVTSLSSDCLVLGVFQEKKTMLTNLGQLFDKICQKHLSYILSKGDFDADIGTTQIIYDVPAIKTERILLVGLGKVETFSLSALRNSVQSVTEILRQNSIQSVDFALLDHDEKQSDAYRHTRVVIEAIGEGLYEYDETKNIKTKNLSLKNISLITNFKQLQGVEQGIEHGKAILKGVTLTKNLSNLPSNICTPSYLAQEAKTLEKIDKITTTVLNESEMKQEKMGSLLSVSKGSREPAKLIIMEYKGGKQGDKPIILVGKGLTFDAGGISLKPSTAMDEMKYDMCGGASVFGTIQAVAEMKLNINLIGIVPSSENLPDGAANKPGDVVTSMSGTTIEILDTDAEGRLILCDALTYAERFKPETVIDIATLTGSCVVALGNHASGLFSNSSQLAAELIKAGEDSLDRVWEMPLWEDYRKQLKSNFADLANIGGKGGGAITAACFLNHFTKKFDWAHLDIAGTAWISGDKKGATGRPVPLLIDFVLSRNSSKG